MSFRTTYILFAILAAELAGLGLLLGLGGRGGDAGFALPSWHDPRAPIDPAVINTVEIDRPGESPLVLVREELGWYRQKPRLRLENYPILMLLRQIIQARRDEETDITSNKKAWGLEPPRMVIRLKRGGNQTWILNVGKESAEKDGVVYVTSSDRPHAVMAVRKDELSGVVNFHFADLWSRRLLEANPFATLSLTIADTQKRRGSTFTLKRNTGGGYDFTEPALGPAEMEPDQTLKSPGVRGLLGAIDKLQAVALEPFDAHPLDWYGLQDDAPGLLITVENIRPSGQGLAEAGETVRATLRVGKKVEKKDEYYVRLTSESVVYRVEGTGLETVREVIQDRGNRLRSRKLLQVPPLTADAITIQNPKGKLELRRAGGQNWLLRSAATGLQYADSLKVHELLVALNADQQVKQFLDDATDAAIGLKDSSPSLAVWVGGLETNPPAAGTFPVLKRDAADKPTARLWFGAAKGDLVQVKRQAGGCVHCLAAPVALLRKVEEGPLEYLDRNLAPFLANQVERLVLTNKGATYELTPMDNRTKWQLQIKTDTFSADPKQVDAMLAALTRIRPAQWVQAKPSAADLKTYGLDSPPLEIEATVQVPGMSAVQKRRYSFGAENKLVDRRKAVYGRLTGTNLGLKTDQVFLVPVAEIEAFEKPEMLQKRKP